MSSDRKAIKSGVFYGIASVVSAGAVFLTTPFFTRIMSKSSYGAYNNFLSWYTMLSVLSFNLYASLISAKRDFKNDFDSYIQSLCVLNFCLVLVWAIITLAFNHLFFRFTGLNDFYICIIFVYIAFQQIFMLFQVNERFDYRYKVSVILIIGVAIVTSVLSMGLAFFCKDSLLGRVIGQVLPTVIAGTMSMSLIFRKKGRFRLTYWKYVLPICLPYIPHLLSLNILNALDKSMIAAMVGNEEVAIYSVAYTCGSVVSLVIGVLNNAFAPWMTEQIESGKSRNVTAFAKYYLLLFELLVFGILLLAPELVSVMGGEQYSDALSLMPAIMLGCAMQLIYTMYVNLEQYYKKTAYMAIVSMMAALANYGLNYIGILYFGYQVAAMTTLISYLILVIGHILIVKRTRIGIYQDSLSYITVAANLLEIPFFLWIYDHSILRLASIVIYLLFIFCLMLKNKQILLFFKERAGR